VEDGTFFQREVYLKHRFWSHAREWIYAPYIGQRENIVAYGFLGADRGQYVRTDAKFNSGMFIKHLRRIHRKFGNVGVIIDGVAPHRSKMFKAFVRDNNWLKILYLLRGLPYRNAVEECWHQAKQDHIIAGHHSSIKHKNDAMSSYFKHKRLDLAVLESISRKPAPSPQNFRPYLYCNQDKGIFISRMLIPMFMGPT